tara:strand:- start:3590 stop:4864 length:1275 start_codon:yes stop_codon:yes gene_type:complete
MSLFRVALEGVGSPDVESFASYVHRTALEHGVYVGEIIRYVTRTDGERKPMFFYRKPQELVRPSLATTALVAAFESAASVTLTEGTLWFMNGPLSLSGDEVIAGFRWCPHCFSEMATFGIPPYFKLLWHMASVVACPTHKTPFEQTCPSCAEPQETYRKQCPLDHCQLCGVSLWAHAVSRPALSCGTNFDREDHDVIQLFCDLATCRPNSLPDSGPRLSLEKIFDHYWRYDMEQELYDLLSRDVLLGALHSETKMSFQSARRFAYMLGIPLFPLLAGEAHLCSGILSAAWVCELKPSFMLTRRRSQTDHPKILRALKRALASEALPPTIPELASRLGVSVGYLEYRYAPIVARLRAVRRDLLRKERERMLLTARNAAVAHFADELTGGCSLSRKQAYRQLRSVTGLPKWVLKNAIQDAYSALHG